MLFSRRKTNLLKILSDRDELLGVKVPPAKKKIPSTSKDKEIVVLCHINNFLMAAF